MTVKMFFLWEGFDQYNSAYIYIYIYIERKTAISFKSLFFGRHYMFCVITLFSTKVGVKLSLVDFVGKLCVF